MAAGDRDIKSKPIDGVKHYSFSSAGWPICDTKGYKYSSPDRSETNCKKCIRRLRNLGIRP